MTNRKDLQDFLLELTVEPACARLSQNNALEFSTSTPWFYFVELGCIFGIVGEGI